MSTLSVLKDIESFLRKDLAGEVLSTRTKTKRTTLLNKVAACINNTQEQDKIDDFLAKQREVSRLQSSDSEKSKSIGKAASDEDDGDYYMDLTEISDGAGFANRLSPPAPEDYGSGSGYESYDSDEETSARPKSSKDEDLSSYFSSSECDIFTYIFLENKNKFLKGKKWLKRVGIVKENHLKYYKKPGDSTAVLDIPLRGYNTTLKNKEGTSFIMIVLSTVSDGDAHRFYVDRDKIDEWSKVLREKTLSVADMADLPPPPVAARPASTLPRLPTPATNGAVQHSSVQRTLSVGKAERAKSLSDISILVTDLSPPPVPPGHPSLAQPASPSNHISKGLKSAMTDMFKKDKTKKRISTAENLGAVICGNLMVFDNKWSKKWCLVKRNQLLIYGKEESPEVQVQLQGCKLLPHSDDPERQFAFKVMEDGKEVVFMEANSSDEMGKWVGVLIAETGCVEPPESEPQYMPIEIRDSVMPTAKQEGKSRKQSTSKKAGMSTFYQEKEEEDVYLDLAAGNQFTPQNITPQKIISPPLPGRTSKSHSVPSEASILEIELDKKNKKTKKTPKTSEPPDSKDEKVPFERKKEKRKDKKKDKRRQTAPVIMSPTESKPTPDIQVIREPYSPGNDTTDGAKVDGAKTEGNESKSVVDTIIQKRRKELAVQKADIKTRLLTLSVKKEELNKYIAASSIEKERGRLRSMLQRVTEDYSKLEKEDISLELELRKLKDKSYNIDSPANKRPPSRRERKPISTGASGNVLSKAQMWEAGNRK